MKTAIFEEPTAREASLKAAEFNVKNVYVIVNASIFYDRINEKHTVVICYYE